MALELGPQSAPELLHVLGYLSRTGNFKKALSRLLSRGAIEKTNPEKPRARNQRYRITAKGFEWLNTGKEGAELNGEDRHHPYQVSLAGKFSEYGSLREVPHVSLPFQVIETVNEGTWPSNRVNATQLTLQEPGSGVLA